MFSYQYLLQICFWKLWKILTFKNFTKEYKNKLLIFCTVEPEIWSAAWVVTKLLLLYKSPRVVFPLLPRLTSKIYYLFSVYRNKSRHRFWCIHHFLKWCGISYCNCRICFWINSQRCWLFENIFLIKINILYVWYVDNIKVVRL